MIFTPTPNPTTSRTTRRSALILAAVLLVGSACTGDTTAADPQPVPPPATATPIPPTPTVPPDSTPTPEPPTATPAPPTPTPEPVSELDDLTAIWTDIWTAAGTIEADKPPAMAAISDYLAPETADRIRTLFRGETTRQVTNHPNLTENPDGTVTINDCMYVLPMAVQTFTNWFTATATPDNNGSWTINNLQATSVTGCVPAEVADNVLAAYAEYRQVLVEAANPVQPDHPGINATMTGSQLAFIDGLLADLANTGSYVLDERVSHPEFFEMVNPEQVLVVDCLDADVANLGLFDANDQRQPGMSTPSPGVRDVNDTTLIFVDGRWKVSETQGLSGVNPPCEFAPTPRGLPIV